MTVIVEKPTGRILRYISGDAESIRLNTPTDCIAVEDPPERNVYRLGDQWIPLPHSPSPSHTFDYISKEWVDSRTIEEVKDQVWMNIKQQRDALEFGGFEFDGGIYDSDQVSQSRIMVAAVAGVNQVWTLADNTTAELSASQLQQLYAALQAHIANVHERGRIARQLIFDAKTKEQVEAVQL